MYSATPASRAPGPASSFGIRRAIAASTNAASAGLKKTYATLRCACACRGMGSAATALAAPAARNRRRRDGFSGDDMKDLGREEAMLSAVRSTICRFAPIVGYREK